METKDVILNTARELFLSNGFKKTSTRKIANAAAVNLGLIPYYFKKKENLVRMVYQEIMRDIIGLEELKKYQIKNSIQQLFIYYALVQHNMLNKKGLFPLYVELIYEDIIAVDPLPFTFKLARQIITEYSLDVNDADLELYVQMMKGAERKLIVQKIQKKVSLSYIDINKFLVLNLLLMLGINKEFIQYEIDTAEKILLSSNLDAALMQ